MYTRTETIAVPVGGLTLGGGAPVRVQAMTNTETANAKATADQVVALAEAGAEIVRFTVDTREAAQAVPEIARRVRDAGATVPLVGDFHFNGHVLLADHPECAQMLDKYRINPGNVGADGARDPNFEAFCRIAAAEDKPVRIGVNAGSLNPDRLDAERKRRAGDGPEGDAAAVHACMIASAIESTEQALAHGLPPARIVLSVKSAVPRHLIALHHDLAARTRQPLHLGLTEAGMGLRGVVRSAASMAVLLEEGLGDTIRVSLTPRPSGDRREEVYAACELLQALGLRRFMPSVTACPGCGRTNGKAYLCLAEATERFVEERMPSWRKAHPGVESLKLAVMGCCVNGPGEAKAADLGVTLPGKGDAPACQVYCRGARIDTLRGTPEDVAAAFHAMVEAYVREHFVP